MATLRRCGLDRCWCCTPSGAHCSSARRTPTTDTSLRLQPPSGEHPFGTDTVGRDILARTIYGGQISLLIGLHGNVGRGMHRGISIGAIAGYYGGLVDSLLMRFTEAMLNHPADLPICW
jgi:ABC-type dipeptide/oligopeptide/nickel transport system permease subunit